MDNTDNIPLPGGADKLIQNQDNTLPDSQTDLGVQQPFHDEQIERVTQFDDQGNMITVDDEGKKRTDGVGTPIVKEFTRKRIANQEHAHEVANALRDEGVQVAERVEARLKREYETGMTEQEERNLSIAEELKKGFPLSLKRGYDKDGNIYYEVNPRAFFDWYNRNQYKEGLQEKAQDMRRKFFEQRDKGERSDYWAGKFLKGMMWCGSAIYLSKNGIALGREGGIDRAPTDVSGKSIESFTQQGVESFINNLKLLEEAEKLEIEDKKREESSRFTASKLSSLIDTAKNKDTER